MKNLSIMWLSVMSVLVYSLTFIASAFAYESLPEGPSTMMEYYAYFIEVIGNLKGGAMHLGIAGVCVILINLMKMTALKPMFEKLGNFKFIAPLAFGAIAEVLFNMPEKLTVDTVFLLVVQGMQVNGALAIAVHHVMDKFLKKEA